MAEDFDQGLEDLESGPGTTADAAERAGRDTADPSSHPTVGPLRSQFGEAVLHHEIVAGDEHVVFASAEASQEVLRWLKDTSSERYALLKDLTAVDYGGGRPLEIVYELWSLEHRRQLRVKVALPVDALEIETVVPLWSAANWLEREVYDMFGVHFNGHPDLRRILMPENYSEGHPLRKDFPLRGRFSRAEQTRRALALDVEDYYTPEELDIVSGRSRRQGESRRRAERGEGGTGHVDTADPQHGDPMMQDR